MNERFHKLPKSRQEEILVHIELKNEWRKDSQEIKQALKKMPKKAIIGMIVELVEKGRLSILDLEELKGV
jgi:aspartate/tyrosine/aromatic aminotransferase